MCLARWHSHERRGKDIGLRKRSYRFDYHYVRIINTGGINQWSN